MRTLLPSSVLLIALMGCSSDALGPPVDPSFAVSGMSAKKCLALAQRLDATNLRVAVRTSEEIRTVGSTTLYLGAAWSQRDKNVPSVTRTETSTGGVVWNTAVTHEGIAYNTADASARVEAWGPIGQARPLVLCDTSGG